MPTGPTDELEVTVEIGGAELHAGTLELAPGGSRSGGATARSGAAADRSAIAPGAGTVAFSYSKAYLSDERAYALDPALPLTADTFTPPPGMALFGALADAGPEGWGRQLMMLAEASTHRRVPGGSRPLGAADLLVRTRDDVREGAIRLRLPDGGAHVATPPAPLPGPEALARLARAAEQVVEGDEAIEAALLSELVAAGASIGGAQPKVAVHGAAGAPAIAKLNRRRLQPFDAVAWEKVTADLAVRAGIDVAPSRLLRADGRSFLVVQRFDRAGGRRVGFASARTMVCAADGDDEHSYLEIAEVLERHSPRPRDDLVELFRRIVFSILVSNNDEHLRNHAMLRRSGGWTLSPLYDVNPNPFTTGRMLTAVDANDHSASIDLALSVAGHFGLSAGEAAVLAAEVEAATRRWREVAAALELTSPEIELMEQAFETGERIVARRLAR